MQRGLTIRDVIEMREIEAFLAVADELHFGRAAERLLLSPSRISQLVRQLEGRIGVALFERTTRQVRLTAIGTQLASDLRRAYADLTGAVSAARAAAQGLEGTVRVGYLTHCEDDAFVRLVARFRAAFPACQVAMIDVTGTELHDALRSGQIDVELGRFHQEPPGDVHQGPVMSREDWVLGVARDHPLADRDELSVEELAVYPVFGIPDALTGRLHNPLYPATTPRGLPITYRGIARTLAEVLAMVARQQNVFPTSTSFPTYYRHPGVVFVPLHGWPQGTRTLLWRAQGNNALVSAFTRVASQGSDPAQPGYGDWWGARTLESS